MYDEINLIKFDPPRITSQNRCIHKLTGIDACAHPHCWTHTHVYLVGLYERDNWLHWAASGSKERENKGLRSAMVSVRSLNVSSCIITCCEDCPKNCRSLAKCLVSTYKIDFPGGSASKESACSAGDLGSIPDLPRRREWQSFQYACLESSMDEEPGGLQSMESHRVRHNAEQLTHYLPDTSSKPYQLWNSKLSSGILSRVTSQKWQHRRPQPLPPYKDKQLDSYLQMKTA